MTIQEILAAADALTPEERAELVEELKVRYTISEPGMPSKELQAEWMRRRDEMRNNPTVGIDGPSAFGGVQTSLISQNK